MVSNFDKAIDELMNTLDNDKTDIEKMTEVTHNILTAMSYKKAKEIIVSKERSEEVFTTADKVKKCGEIMMMSYELMLDFIKKEVIN